MPLEKLDDTLLTFLSKHDCFTMQSIMLKLLPGNSKKEMATAISAICRSNGIRRHAAECLAFEYPLGLPFIQFEDKERKRSLGFAQY